MKNASSNKGIKTFRFELILPSSERSIKPTCHPPVGTDAELDAVTTAAAGAAGDGGCAAVAIISSNRRLIACHRRCSTSE